MNRKEFIKYLSFFPLAGSVMKLNVLNSLAESAANTDTMPVLFLGHGSPMNAIEENEFVAGFRNVGKGITKPTAIVCISAHWETKGTYITAMPSPRTIHDFWGFPQALFDVQYPAPGNPELAKNIQAMVKKNHVELDESWGLDHGAWSVIKHLYPNADVPVIQLSLDYRQTPQYHYELAQQLQALRNKGVLIVGSGNMVHNLGMVAWDKLNTDNYGYDWAIEANTKMKSFILNNQHDALINYSKNGKAFALSIPTPEHYLPLLYVLGLKNKNETVSIFNDKAVGGSLYMTSVKVG
ncbi:MAG: 4,5-DOPA dioxygenase extradiol [Bacteroidota bacterium]|jgi:4,5-DOPA dioxygenase extradiol